MKDMEKYYLAIHKDLPYHKSLADQTDLFDDYHFKKDDRPLSRVKDFEEILYYAEEIMSYNDPKMLERFNELKNKNHILINYISKDCADGAYLLTFYDNKKPYISFSLNSDIGDVGKIVHEAGHLLQYDLIKNSHGNNTYLFREVASHYKELVSYDLLKDNKIFETDMDICLNNYLDELNIHLIELYFGLEDICNADYSLFKNLIYSYGMIIALKYYDIYRKDPEKAKYLTNRFIHESSNLDFLTVLNSFGLNEEEIISGKVLKKYLKK